MIEVAVELSVGDAVSVPWGLDEPVDGVVVEVWGTPAHHVRVQIDGDDDESGAVILVSPSIVTKRPAPVR